MRWLTAIIVLALAATSTSAHAQATSSGWENYCLRTRDCTAGDPRPHAGGLAALRRVNRAINRANSFHYEMLDTWYDVTEVGYGDCEDFAIAKRARLVRLGWPRANLPIAFTWRNGVAHAVLLAWTDERWYVLDQATPEVLPIEQSPYRDWLIEPPRGRVWARLPVPGATLARRSSR